MAIATATAGQVNRIDPKQIRELEDQRSDLVSQYVDASPHGSRGWKIGAAVPAGLLGATAGGALLWNAIKNKGALHQGLSLMFEMPMAAGAAGAAAGLMAWGVAEIATRPTGAEAKQQVASRRAELKDEITAVDTRLHDADGRVSGALPDIDDSVPKPSIGRAGLAGLAGLGIGLPLGAALGGAMEGLAPSSRIYRSGLFGMLGASAATVGAVSYLNQRGESNDSLSGTSLLRSAAIGGGLFAASGMLKGFQEIPIVPRMAVLGAAGVLLGVGSHVVTASSKD